MPSTPRVTVLGGLVGAGSSAFVGAADAHTTTTPTTPTTGPRPVGHVFLVNQGRVRVLRT
jgi:hypothetical protein